MIIELKNFSELKSQLNNSKEYILDVECVSNFCVPIKENKNIHYWFDWKLTDCAEDISYLFNLDNFNKDFAQFITTGNITINNKEVFCYLLYLGYKISNPKFSAFDIAIAKSKYFGIFNYVPNKYELITMRNTKLNALRAELPFKYSDEKMFDIKVKEFIKTSLYSNEELPEDFNTRDLLYKYMWSSKKETTLASYCSAIILTKRLLRHYKELTYEDYCECFNNLHFNKKLKRKIETHDIVVNRQKEYLISFRLNNLILNYYETVVYNNNTTNEYEFYNNIYNRYEYIKGSLTDSLRANVNSLIFDSLNEDYTKNIALYYKDDAISFINILVTLAIIYKTDYTLFEKLIVKRRTDNITKDLVIRFANDYFKDQEVYNLGDMLCFVIDKIAINLNKINDSSIILFYFGTDCITFKVKNNVHPSVAYNTITEAINSVMPHLLSNCLLTSILNNCFIKRHENLPKDLFDYMLKVHPDKFSNVLADVHKLKEEFNK